MKYRGCSHGIYNDVWVKGEIIRKGYRPSSDRYDHIRTFCRKFKRPFSVLDIGAAEGYFTFRLANDFEGIFTAVEHDRRRNVLPLCIENENNKVFLLQKKLNLKTLKALQEVQHYDVILALNVVHHFKEPWQEVLDTIMKMCDYCIFEHPDEKEASCTDGKKKIRNADRLLTEKLNINNWSPESLVNTGRHEDIDRELLLLQQPTMLDGTKSGMIERRWSGGDLYNFPNSGIVTHSTFDKLEATYLHRKEKRPWIQGLNLRTFLEANGVYPTGDMIMNMLDEVELPNSTPDLAPHNLILGEGKLHLIDQDHDRKGEQITSRDRLKSYLKNTLMKEK